MNAKKWFAAAVLAMLILPFFIFSWKNFISSFFRPTDMVFVTPAEFETAFNEQMEPYGLSIDLENAVWTHTSRSYTTTVPVTCADGSELTCRILASVLRRRQFVHELQFDRTPAAEGEKTWMPELMDALLHIFHPTLVDASDFRGYQAYSWNDAMDACRSFENDRAQTSIKIDIVNRDDIWQVFRLTREQEAPLALSLRLHVYTS